MKAVCIIGSPRTNGSTAYLVDKVIEGMKETNIQTKRYCLGDLKINYCCGCKHCYKMGICIQNDDVQKHCIGFQMSINTLIQVIFIYK